MSERFSQGDTVRVRGGRRAGKVGVIYDGMGVPRRPWLRQTETGPEFSVYFDLPTDAEWFDPEAIELVTPMPEPGFQAGDRVRVRAFATWARGEAGTVNAGGWDASLTPRIARRPGGPTRVYMVHLDHRHPDSAGEGSYAAGEFDEVELEKVNDPAGPGVAYPAARLAAEAEALRRAMADPTLAGPSAAAPRNRPH